MVEEYLPKSDAQRAHGPQAVDGECVVGVGEYRIARNPGRLVCLGLGSCIGVAVYDLKSGVGGLAHAMLPRYDEGRDKVHYSKYADSAIILMADELVELGADRAHLKAKMVGGAQMFSFGRSEALNIGERNIHAARETLRKERIPLLAEDTGGSKGRTITFSTIDGSIQIKRGGEILLL